MSRGKIGTLWILCVALPALAHYGGPVPMDASRQAKLAQEIPSLMEKAGIPGLSIAVLRNNQTAYLQGFGVRDANKHEEVVNSATMFNVGSLSKPVFAYGVLKLVEEGKLKLDEPLAPYVSKEFTAGDPRFQLITARMVLSHRTGLLNWRGDGQPLQIYFTPGERFSYSGEGVVLLQKAVEKITGQPLNSYMEEAVFVPLGMRHSSYVWRESFAPSVAIGHDVGGSAVELFKADKANAAASLETTVEDYAKFLEAILQRKGLKPATFAELEKAQIAVDPACSNCVDGTPSGKLSRSIFWGLGFGIEETAAGESLWHWGDNGVFKAFFVIEPATGAGVVYFTNSENGLSIGRQLVAETLGGDQPAFAWLKYENYDSPGILFSRALRRQPTRDVLGRFSAALAKGTITEGSVNSAGYWLVGQKGRSADAILVFQENVRNHPTSWNTYDSLGEAYKTNGDKELAITSYKKALELNPTSANSEVMLKQLENK